MRLDGKKFFLALLFVSLLALVSVGAFAQQDEEIKILWDDIHGQYYNSGLCGSLISDLEGQGVIVDRNSTEFVITELNATLLSGYSILVLPNPQGRPLTQDEISSIADFVQGGGGLIILGDVQYLYIGTKYYYGQPDSLNDILRELGVADKVQFWGTNNRGDEIKDDIALVGRNWQQPVGSEYFNPHIISAGIKKVVTNTASLEVADSDVIVATSPPTSYTVDVDNVRHRSGRIPWLVALEVGEGKVVICGSSKMFSNVNIAGIGQPFISYGDNEKLFFNLIWWLTGQRLVAPAAVTTFFPFLDIFGFIAGIFAVHNFKRDMRKLGIYIGLVGIFYMAIAIGQSLLAGNIYFGTAIPGWGQATGGLTDPESPWRVIVPAWGVAAGKYFFAGVIFSAAGAIYFMIVLRFAKEYRISPTEVFGWLAGWPLMPLAGSLLLLIGGGYALSVGFTALSPAELPFGNLVFGLLELLIGFLLILSGLLVLKIRYLMAGTVIASVVGLTGIILFVYVELIHAQLTGMGFVLEGIVPVVAGILGFLGLSARQKTIQR